MEARSGDRSLSRDRGAARNNSMLPQPSTEQKTPRAASLSRPANENDSPRHRPKAFQGMLRTNTETGDIGLFSMRPARVPQSTNIPQKVAASRDMTLQKPMQAFQPYGVPFVDDRRKLPSYSRDPASEIISMYENESQKSPRHFEETEYRSYSMTQTSLRHTSLSNHRSYASLRSQAEMNGLVRRPRSPFAYPTRLKRPGFRPSSPALTDGGFVDYSRRSEIDRSAGAPNSSSPSSIYAPNRRPVPSLTLRPEANKSTSSLLSQASSAHHSVSPQMRPGNERSSNSWSRKPGQVSVNNSPARSTFSLASTSNTIPNPTACSSLTTPKKQPPPPLYYDYTEEFDIDDYNRPEPLESPPQFRIDRTIPEDRPLSADSNAVEMRYNSVPKLHIINETSQLSGASNSDFNMTPSKSKHDDHQPASSSMSRYGSTKSNASASRLSAADAALDATFGDRKSAHLSSLGLGAQEHAEQVFGLPSSSPLGSSTPTSAIKKDTKISPLELIADSSTEKQVSCSFQSSSSSSILRLSQFPPFPDPPTNTIQGLDLAVSIDTHLDKHSSHGGLTAGSSKAPSTFRRSAYSENAPSSVYSESKSPLARASTTGQPKSMRSSKILSIDKSLMDLADLIKSFENDDQAGHTGKFARVSTTDSVSDTEFGARGSFRSKASPPVSSFKRPSNDRDEAKQMRHDSHNGGVQHLPEIFTKLSSESPSIHLSQQIPRRLSARSGSPMFAPKPISPARQLKLKNSVPQLMKALPPLPPESLFTPIPNSEHHHYNDQTPQPVRRLSERRPTPFEVFPSNNITAASIPNVSQYETAQILNPESTLVEPTENVKAKREIHSTQASMPLPRLKLKTKPSSFKPVSTFDSRPWNSDESYPWTRTSPNVLLPSLRIDGPASESKPPKFKLKVTRASLTSEEIDGTVRVNRTLGDVNAVQALDLRHPKDLFTPAIRFDNLFRQVSKRFQPRKASSNDSSTAGESFDPHLSQYELRARANDRQRSHIRNPQPPTLSPGLASPSEARSFFSDDSSYYHRVHSLRKRLSNFKARISAPYTNRPGAQSYDDLTWRDRNRVEAPKAPTAARSFPNLHESNAESEEFPQRQATHKSDVRKLRAKVSQWFKSVKSVIKARFKSHGGCTSEC